MIFAGTNGYVDGVPVDDVQRYETEIRAYFQANHADLLEHIRTTGTLPDGDALDKAAAHLHRELRRGEERLRWPVVKSASSAGGSAASSRPRRSPRRWS